MAISDRINNWVEDRRLAWGEALGKFLLNTLSAGATKFIEDMEPDAIANVFDILERIRTDENSPPQVKAMIERIEAGGHPIPLLIVIPLAILFLVPMVFSLAEPLARLFTYAEERVLHSFRLDPSMIGSIWLRDKPTWEWLWDDLRDLGWDKRRIEAARELTKWLPPVSELIRWTAKEVFEPGMRDKYGLDEGSGLLDRELFYKLGIEDDQIDNNWAAHWEHATWIQMVELLRRGLLTSSREVPSVPETESEWAARDAEGSKELFSWYGLVEIAPFWRDTLTQLVWEIPTRVDVRRWWDMRTISEEELYSIYHRQGYHGDDLVNYVRWTKVYTDFPMMMTRFKNGWITEEDIREWLRGLEIPEDRITQFIEEKTKPEEPARVEEGRALTKTEIYKGVKTERLTWEQGIDLLIDLNYSRAEADYLLDINVGALAGSPDTYEEFKQLTTKWRKAAGRKETWESERVREAAAIVVQATTDVEALQRAVAEEQAKIVDEDAASPEQLKPLKRKRVALHRAEAVLQKVQQDYQSRVAEVRHAPPET